MKKILLLSDSRGVHKPVGSTHRIYGEMLAANSQIQLTAYRCPWQWTTIPDFLSLLEHLNPDQFDHVILHAGIVDHSPRGHSSMLARLVDPEDGLPAKDALDRVLSRIEPSRKIVNRKRTTLEQLFGKESLNSHLSSPFDEEYEGEKTINLYSIGMMRESILPRLRAMENLIFISANNLSPGWNGDYPRQRPVNIGIIEEYSRILCENLPNVVNLHQWADKQVRKYTCDNMHLTHEGSDWVHDRLLEHMGIRRRNYLANRTSVWPPENPEHWPLHEVKDRDSIEEIRMTDAEPFDERQLQEIRKRHNLGDAAIATLAIGFRLGNQPERLVNMRHLIGHLKKTYPGAFDILLVEQDVKPRLDDEGGPEGCRYEFLYNPNAYNRGWAYNVVAKHLTKSQVVVFMDTDVIPGANFMECVELCHKDYDAISPNRNLFYSTEEQTREFHETGNFQHFTVTEESLKNPTTLGGGMLVVNRQSFLSVGGFEQYVGYGCEDRTMDVTMLALFDPARVRMDSLAYFHQYHPISGDERAYFQDIYNHMAELYCCEYAPDMPPTSYIHRNCRHADKAQVERLRDLRMPHIGNPDLYTANNHLTVNGLPGKLGTGITLVKVEGREPVFPPDCDGTKPYNDSEELTGRFANAWAPAVKRELAVDDTRQLQFFYNRFKGKRCFILGNGPSLNQHDLDLLRNEYCFAVNSFYYKTRETGFTPTFFVVEDSSVIKENQEEIVAYEAPFKFFPTIYQSLHEKRPGTYFFPMNRGFYDKFSPNYAIPRFSTDISKVAYCGQSVTYINLQLAYYMGFTEVYLIGMDFNYIIPQSHSRKGDVLTSDTDDPNHFHKDYFGKGKTWKDPKLDRVLMNYKMARLVYECAGRGVYNATKGGRLEEFERVDYDGLFGGFDKRFSKEPLDLTRPPDDWSTRKYPSGQQCAEPTTVAAAVIDPQKIASVDSFLDARAAERFLSSTASLLLLYAEEQLANVVSDQRLTTRIQSALGNKHINQDIKTHFLNVWEHVTLGK